jgi:hypothetical protein
MPVVRWTRIVPSATWVTLILRPAIIRFSMLRLYKQRIGIG